MTPGWLLYSPVFAQLLPPLAALRNRGRDRTRLKIVLWCLLLFAGDGLSWWLGHIRGQNNLWLDYLTTALEGALMLWILSGWQISAVARLAVTFLVPAYLLAEVLLYRIVENNRTFSLATGTLSGFVLLCLVLYTLVTRSLAERGYLVESDWFWVCSGLALYYCFSTALEPMVRYLISADTNRLVMVFEFKAVWDCVAMMVIARGLLCPMSPPRSGTSSSPPSSRSLSYS
jgi:hypothetical protein